MRPTAHRLNAPRVLASMVSLAGRQEARTSAKVPRANQTRCIGQPRIRARALTLGNLGGQVHREPGRHRRLSTGYSGPRGCCVPAWIGGVARQGRGVETSVCLIRFQFTGAPQTENGLQSHGRREEVRDLSGAGVNAYLGRVTDRGLPLPAEVDTAGIPQGRPRRSGGGAQNRAFVLAHLLPPVMNKFPLPARVAADSVSAGSGSRDPASSGRPPAELR